MDADTAVVSYKVKVRLLFFLPVHCADSFTIVGTRADTCGQDWPGHELAYDCVQVYICPANEEAVILRCSFAFLQNRHIKPLEPILGDMSALFDTGDAILCQSRTWGRGFFFVGQKI